MIAKIKNWKTLKRKLKSVLRPLKIIFFDPNFRKRAIYTNYRKKENLKKNVIFYEAYHGQSMTSNPYAVFTYLINNNSYKNFHHVWAITDRSLIPIEHINNQKVTFVIYQSAEYLKYLATAKYLINDTTFPSFFHKRKNQIYANIWHGTPLKTMGMDIKARGHTNHKNIQRNFLSANYFVTPNEYTADKLLRSHGLLTLFSGNILDTGYPRVDLMFNINKQRIRQKLSISPNEKIILYAPTWRATSGNEEEHYEELLQTVQSIQTKVGRDYTVLFKSHYYHQHEDSAIPNHIDTNEVLAVTNILITDYSSIFFEFLATERPIIFYTYDAVRYLDYRGTYIDLNDLPGPICKNKQELIETIFKINSVQHEYHDRYNHFLHQFAYHDDGQATTRFIDCFLHEKPSKHLYKIGTEKTKILMYGGGFLNNGITSSAINLLNAIDYDKYDVTLIDYGRDKKIEKWNNIKKVNKNVNYIYRVGGWNASFLDLVCHAITLRRGFHTPFMKRIAPVHMYKAEMERITGLTRFDIGIDFSGYSPIWTVLFAFGNFKKKSIYLHSDMNKETRKRVNNRYPHRKNLKVVFSLYNYFDQVLSVSELTHKQNKKHLKPFIKKYQEKMDYVINTIDYQSIFSLKDNYQYELSMEEDVYFDLQPHLKAKPYPMPDQNEINFITIGRLGPEKDHTKLIHAFAKVARERHDIKLYIVGDGALREHLTTLIQKLQLDRKVFLTGQLKNPYPLLNLSDCFVLSSNHEGQPVVLLEALILGKPIIVTDIPGSRSVVEGGYGFIVHNSVQGLVAGMNRFINGKQLNHKIFDYKNYSQQAIDMFYEKVCDIHK